MIGGRKRAKHIDIRKHFAHEVIQREEMRLVKAPRARPDGHTNPLRHRLLYTDSPSCHITRAHRQAVGQIVSSIRAEPWRSDISERRCGDALWSRGGWLMCAGHGTTVGDD